MEPLKQVDIIRQFFDVLSDDRGQDRGRFEFWSRYYEQMDEVYIALGSAAYYSGRPDMAKLRRDLEGRLLKLSSTGSDTNAFIMFMGPVVVVEFSQKGNAAFRYRRGDAPVNDASRTVAIWQLKRSPPGIRMLHMRDWQRQFSRDLGIAIGMTSVGDAPIAIGVENIWVQAPSLRNSYPDRLLPGGSRAAQPIAQRGSSEPDDIYAFLRRHNLDWRDNRPKGGNLTIYAGLGNRDIVSQLERWAFKYSEKGRFWWRTT